MRWLLVLVLLMLPVPAAADPASAKVWLCEKIPGTRWCRVRVVHPPGDTEAEEPVEWLIPVLEPEPDPLPDLSPAYPPDRLPQPQASPPVSEPAPATKATPEARPSQRPAPAKARRQRSESEPERKRTQAARPQVDGGSCFFPVTCAYVCQQARAGDNRRGTPCQNAKGEACIRRLCPEILRR